MKRDKMFYVGQKAFIEKDGKVLVLFDPRNHIDFPGGKIQEGESDFVASLMREVDEETSISIEVGDPFTVWDFVISNTTNPDYKGKTVFLVGFRCGLKGGEFKLSSEHSGYRWVGKAELREIDDGSAHFKALEKYFASG